MTLATPLHTLTADDLLDMPDNNSLEFVNGKSVEKQVSFLSSNVASWINGLFVAFVKNNPVAKVCGSDLGFQCFQMLAETPDLMRKPDVSVIRIERLRALKNQNPGYMPIPPDLAVEVISTNDTVTAIDQKVFEYSDAGFPLVWVVDPILRSVTVYPNPGRPIILTKDQLIDAPNALPGFSCKVSDLFPSV